MKNFIRIVLLLSFTLSSVVAQKQTITGVVVDRFTDEPLSFTNVGIVGKSAGTVSNSEGVYTLSMAHASLDDTVFFSFVGYQQCKLTLRQLSHHPKVALEENTIQLASVSIRSKEYTPLELLDSLKKKYYVNHTQDLIKQRIFSRDASYTHIHQSDIDFKKSSFKAIDGRFVYAFNQNMPEQLNVYNDYLVDFYTHKSKQKLLPIEGQSLIENWDFDEEFNKRIKLLAEDVEDNVREEEKYFKVRSGIFAGKLNFGADSSFTLSDDSLNYITSTKIIRGDLNYLLRTYSTLESRRWDFFSEYDWYTYALSDIAVVNNELAYIIQFKPAKRKAKYQGKICIAVKSYALLQVDYAFADGKTGTGMSLLGVEYLVQNRSGHVIYEKGNRAYHLKYLSRESSEHFAINRKLTIKQKEDSGWFDKTLQEVKVNLNLDVTFDQKKEVLVVSHHDITESAYDAVEEPATYKLKKVSKYSPELWKNSSILEPTKALKEYQKQF